ncbi:biotin/lipoate--protein ligase family protein [Elioraea rosea]|uniref:biotin/lipoate--protein ligase family protein n=1 Tax=Elioraea rosea TaxID=2492390 RepID=UPI0013155CD4|nr:biotin/lipoate--protein ligase family protein [Elioraea rosea]
MRAADLDRRLDLPPLFRGVILREGGDAFGHACAIAAEEGAGTLVLSRGSLLFDCAVILEPAMPLARTRVAFLAGMAALADALAVAAPPEHPIGFAWPGTVRIDGALLGGMRMANAPVVGDLQAPAWLVLHAALRLGEPADVEPGLHPDRTSLEQQGFEDADGARLAERFARHLMAGLYTWQDEGLAPVAEAYLSRLDEPAGVRRGIDPSGDLILRDEAGHEERLSLAEALAATPSWLARL